MRLEFVKLSPTKNTTILVTSPVEPRLRAAISRELMKEDSVCGEQAGFLAAPQNCASAIRLEMMGGEFCANATMAVSAYLARLNGADEANYSIEVSGCIKPLFVSVKRDGEAYVSTVPMPLPATVSTIDIRGASFPLVNMPGISHAILPLALANGFSHSDIKSLSEAVDSDAFGLIFYSDGVMRPFVYVKSTDTAVWESACGSGTAAVGAYLALARGENAADIIQPGGVIKVSAKVKNGLVEGLFITGRTLVMIEGAAYIQPL